MTRTLPEWAYLIDENGRHWRKLTEPTEIVADDGVARPPNRSIYAISSRDLVSISHWVQSKDPEIIKQVVEIESTKHGIQTPPGPGRVSDWKPIEYNGTRTLVQSVFLPWDFDLTERKHNEFSDFLPQFALYPPPENGVALWKESNEWIAGYSRNGRWIHIQSVGGENEAQTFPNEIALTVLELSARELLEPINQIVVWGTLPGDVVTGLQARTDLPVHVTEKPSPASHDVVAWDFEPHAVSEKRAAQKGRKQAALLSVLLVLIAVAMGGAAFYHLHLLESGNQRLKAKIDENSATADSIEQTMTRWRTLGPAVDPSRSTVEIFHRIATLLPEKGFRIKSLQYLDQRTIVIRGEASSMTTAIQMKSALENAELLSDYKWEIPPPNTANDVTELLATGTYLY